MTTPDSTRTGGCLCGAVRYRLSGPLGRTVHCHCRMCQRSSGAGITTWVTLPAGGFALTAGSLREFRSSDVATRGFCAQCGSPVTFRYDAHPERIGVTAGTLDDPAHLAPAEHDWTATAVPWLPVADGLPRNVGGSPG